jgi:hypothetical protein
VGLSPGPVKPKTIKFVFFASPLSTHLGVRAKLARNQNNVFQWRDMSPFGLLFQCTSTINIQPIVLVWYKVDVIIISSKCDLLLPWYSWKIGQYIWFESCQFRPRSVFFVSWRLKCSAYDFRCLRYYCDNVSIS